MMPAYPILCYRNMCSRPAIYKIASRWSDGVTEELKTYALSCEQCLPEQYRLSRERQAACRRAPGETLDPPGIYRLDKGSRDRQLKRLTELEPDVAREA